MKKFFYTVLGGSLLWLTGCFVLSVHPFYEAEDVVFEADLLGRWNGEGQHWHFSPDNEEAKAYRVTYVDGGKESLMSGHLFKLEGEWFLDLFGESCAEVMPPPIPSHVLLRARLAEGKLILVALDYGWMKEFLEKNPKELHHVWRVNPGAKPEEKYFVLTAGSGELRAFVLKHLKTAEAWHKGVTLERALER